GALTIKIKQTALAAIADAFRLDVLDENGNIVYSAVTENSLVGDVAGLPILGLIGNDTLTATIEGLPPGKYSVVVRNDQSALDQIVQDLTLADLGENGVVLGPDNQDLILDAVESALGGGILGATAKTALKVVLEVSGGLGVGELVGIITNVLQPLDALDLLDGVLDAVSEALLSNTLTLLQATDITTQLTEVTFGDNEIRGNVIEGENGAGADTPSVGTTVTKVTFDGQDYFPDENTEEITVFGQYGTLVMSANGKY